MWKQYLDLPRSVHILCLGTFVNRAGSFFVIFLTIYLSDKLGFEVTFATWCMGLFGSGALVASLLGGHLADRFGRRIVMIASLVGGALILAVFSSLASRDAIMAATFAYAVLITAYRPAASAMIGDLVDPAQRPPAFGLMHFSINLGFTCGAAVGGKLASFSFPLLFWSDALTTLAYGLIIYLAIAETLPGRTIPDPNDSTDQNAAGEPSGDAVPESVSVGRAALHILRDGPFMLFCLGTILVGIVFMQSFSTLPVYLQSRGFQPEDYGYVIAVNGLLIVLLLLPLTTFLSRFDRLKVVMLGAATIGVGFGLNAFATLGWHFAGAVVVWTFGEMMQSPFNSAIVTDLAPRALRARYMGVFGMSFSAALMIGAPLGGEVLDRLGSNVLWIGGMGVAGLAVALYLLIYRSVHRRCMTETIR